MFRPSYSESSRKTTVVDLPGFLHYRRSTTLLHVWGRCVLQGHGDAVEDGLRCCEPTCPSLTEDVFTLADCRTWCTGSSPAQPSDQPKTGFCPGRLDSDPRLGNIAKNVRQW